MIYGYVSVDIKDDKKELTRQVRAIKKYAKYLRQDLEIVKDVTDISKGKHQDSYKEELKNMVANLEKGDIVLIASVEDIFPDKRGRAGILTTIYYRQARAIVIDYPALNINIDEDNLSGLSRLSIYGTIVDSLLDARDFLLSNKEHVPSY